MNKTKKATSIYMALDQYGQTFHNLKHPRKELCEQLGYSPSSAHKMYNEKKDGTVLHTGYVIGPHWLDLYEVIPYRKEV